MRGLIGAAGLRGTRAAATHFGVVWGTEQVMLPALGVAPPLWEWGAKEVAIDAFHHLIYAGATDANTRAQPTRPTRCSIAESQKEARRSFRQARSLSEAEADVSLRRSRATVDEVSISATTPPSGHALSAERRTQLGGACITERT